MDDMISRAAAIRIAEKYGCNNGSALGHHSGVADCIASEIAILPAVDAAPVVQHTEQASFATIMHHWQRLCRSMGRDNQECEGCPVLDHSSCCDGVIASAIVEDCPIRDSSFDEVESAVMNWAKKHPETDDERDWFDRI